MFDNIFFDKHQGILLRLLNLPAVGRVMRKMLWIDDYSNPVHKITPSAVHVDLGGGHYRATIYSNKQYTEAMHRSFSWLWRLIHAWDMVVANRLRPAWNLGFDTYSSQPDGTAGLDCPIQSTTATTNYETSPGIESGESNAGVDILRSLIKFDFSSIPSVGEPSSATFSLWQHAELADNTRTHRLYRQKRAWVESEATWNIYSTGNNWQTAGGFGANDCEQTGIASLSLASNEAAGEKQWTNFDLALLKDMWDGDFTNNGFLLKADTESNDWHRFRSSDYATAGERPKMVIVYTAFAVTLATTGAMTAVISPNKYKLFSADVPKTSFRTRA